MTWQEKVIYLEFKVQLWLSTKSEHITPHEDTDFIIKISIGMHNWLQIYISKQCKSVLVYTFEHLWVF